MKAKLFVIGLFLFALTACTQRAKVPEPVEGPSLELSAIDSLMWRQPDSALVCLLPYFDTCSDGMSNISTPYDKHYTNLMLAELLYKNYLPQENRKKLQQAVAYYDSLLKVMDTQDVSIRRLSRSEASPMSAQTIAFLDARSHYINGVGYYENDSVVRACTEYLLSIETVESHFPEVETYNPASPHPSHLFRFMALTYNRLGELFSEQFMLEPSIVCYKNVFRFCEIEPTSPYGIGNALYRIGIQYDNLGEKDSANYYYTKAIEALPDTSNLFYRDMTSSQALLGYQLNHQAEPALKRLKQMIALAEDGDEQLTRYSTIGYIFFEEKQYDSAKLYLKPVFEYKSNDPIRIQVAEYLSVISDSTETSGKPNVYILFLAKHKPLVADEEAKVSQLNTQFQDYLNWKQKREIVKEKAHERKITARKTVTLLAPFLLAIVLLAFMTLRKHYTKSLSEKEAETQKRLQEKDLLLTTHEAKAKTMEQQLKRLKAAKETHKQQRTKAEQNRNAFLCEPTCRNIIASVSDLHLSARSQYGDFHQIALDEATGIALGNAVAKHFPDLVAQLATLSPKLTWKEMQTCYLYLLHLEDAQIAALLQCHNSTIHRRKAKLQKAFGTTKPFPDFIQNLAYRQD